MAAIEEMVHGFEFSRVLDLYRAASREGDEERKASAVKWLRGEYRTKTEARTDLGISAIIDDGTWYDYLKIFARFLTGAGYKGLLVLIDELVNLYKIPNAGYKGLLVLIDELVNLYKIPNAISRQYNYEKILQMYNDTLQGKQRHAAGKGAAPGHHHGRDAHVHRGPQARRVLLRGPAQPAHPGPLRT